MRTLSVGRRFAVLTSVVAVWATLGYACSVEDENPGSSRNRGGDGSAEGAIDPNNNPDAPIVPALCGKYGGYDNVKTIAAAILAEAAQDCRISQPFADLDPGGTQHLQECFQILVGNAFQCPGVQYITTGENRTKDSQGENCRSMAQAHQALNLRNADFQAFTDAIASALGKNGVTPDDIRAIAPAFEGYRTGVVQTLNQPDKNTHCTCPDGLYMGKQCVPDGGPPIIDAGNDANDAADAADDG